MSPPSPVGRCHLCNGHGWIPPAGPLVVTTTGNSSGQMAHVVSSSSPPIRHSRGERFARPAPPSSKNLSFGRWYVCLYCIEPFIYHFQVTVVRSQERLEIAQ